ncbi:hypothetical protein ACFQU7_11600 [Pseudoroseomonas wenyumeiae]
MYGEAGNDTFTFSRIQASTMDGGSGNDHVSIGNMLSGSIDGGSGNDLIEARTMLGTVSGVRGTTPSPSAAPKRAAASMVVMGTMPSRSEGLRHHRWRRGERHHPGRSESVHEAIAAPRRHRE